MADNTVILKDIPVNLTMEYFTNRSKSTGAIKMYQKYIPFANEYARPKSVIKWCTSEIIEQDTVKIEGVTFKSKLLYDKLKDSSHVLVCAITAGNEIKDCEKIPHESVRDIMSGAVLNVATEYTFNFVVENFDIDSTSFLQPGSLPDWPIENNKILFEILGQNVADEIEISLSNHGYMLPWNSLSGILFADNSGYKNCSLCKRLDCVGRRAPFDKDEYERIFG